MPGRRVFERVIFPQSFSLAVLWNGAFGRFVCCFDDRYVVRGCC